MWVQKGCTGRWKWLTSDLKCAELSMYWAMCKRQIMLIYNIFFISFGKNLLVNITMVLLGPPRHVKLSIAWKMIKYGLSLIRIFLYLYRNKGSIQIRENTSTISSIHENRVCRLKKAHILAYFMQWSSLWH